MWLPTINEVNNIQNANISILNNTDISTTE